MNPEQAFKRMVDAGGFDGLVSYPPTVITLPMPPSINRLYRAVRGRNIMSETYRTWKAEAGTALMAQRPRKITGKVSILTEISPQDRRRRDLDNVGFKAVLDLLVAMRIIEADDSSCVREITARWVTSGPPCTVTITRSEEPT